MIEISGTGGKFAFCMPTAAASSTYKKMSLLAYDVDELSIGPMNNIAWH
jgi:hypothetical protein